MFLFCGLWPFYFMYIVFFIDVLWKTTLYFSYKRTAFLLQIFLKKHRSFILLLAELWCVSYCTDRSTCSPPSLLTVGQAALVPPGPHAMQDQLIIVRYGANRRAIFALAQYGPDASLIVYRILPFLKVAVHAIIPVMASLSLIFVHHLFLGVPSYLFKMRLNRKRKKRSEIEAEKEIITWTAGHRNGKIQAY